MSSKSPFIGNSRYDDASLGRLKAPDIDVYELERVLKASEVGQFDEVITLLNQDCASARKAIARFYDQRQRDDLLLLYFSGHGVKDEQGHLYLALRDTESRLLAGSAIETDFITGRMDRSFSKRQVLVLDCCHSGAFAHGAKSAQGVSVGTAEAFEGTGLGRVVLTATDSTQYAWEGDQVIGDAQNSLFTHFLIEGLKTGAADKDADGVVTVDELYDYVREQVVTTTPRQTPHKWSYLQRGAIVLARNPFVNRSVLSAELDQAINSHLSTQRLVAVAQLEALLHGHDAGRADAALKALKVLSQDDSRKVANAAAQALKTQDEETTGDSSEEVPELEVQADKRDPGRPSDIFISYAHEDHEKARALANVLSARGWNVWWDRKIAPGESYDVVIERELRSCNCAIVLWSSSSVHATWVRNEARRAARRKVLLPILIEAVETPLEFENLQAADLTSWQDTDPSPDQTLYHSGDNPELEAIIERVLALSPIPRESLARAAVEQARQDVKSGRRRAALARLEQFRPAHYLVTRALAELRAEDERRERKRAEAERREAEAARIERERVEGARRQVEAVRTEQERVETERRRAEAARIEREGVEGARRQAEAARAEQERVETERRQAEAARIERERVEGARRQAEAARTEQERVETERRQAEAARIERERVEGARRQAVAARAEQERVETERRQAEAVRIERERVETERREAEASRIERERLEAARNRQAARVQRQHEAERLAAETPINRQHGKLAEELTVELNADVSPHTRSLGTPGRAVMAAAALVALIAAAWFASLIPQQASVDHVVARDSRRQPAPVVTTSPTSRPSEGLQTNRPAFERPITGEDPAKKLVADKTPPPVATATPETVPRESPERPEVKKPPSKRLDDLRTLALSRAQAGAPREALTAAAEGLRIEAGDPALKNLVATLLRDGQSSARRAREEAIEAEAVTRAEDQFQQALKREREAVNLQRAGKLEAATRGYWGAAELFTAALTESRDVARNEKAAAERELRREKVTPPPPIIRSPQGDRKDAERPLVDQLLRRYEAAYASLNAEAVRDLYPSAPLDQLAKDFANSRSYSLTVVVDSYQFVFTDSQATATVVARIGHDVVPKSGARSESDKRQTIQLDKQGANWIIKQIR